MDSELGDGVLQGARAIAPFTANEDRFRALFDAFQAFDRGSFRRLLDESGGLDRCELVCGWLRSKACVLLCLELCGPPPEKVPSLREFAEVLVRVTGNEEWVERLAAAIGDRDPDVMGTLVDELAIRPFCHLLCHWACEVRADLICDVLCAPQPVHLGDLTAALSAAGQAVSKLLANERAFSEAAAAAEIQDCERLRAAVSAVGLAVGECELICRWLCSWRCLWVCVQLCQDLPAPAVPLSVSEAFQFAQATARLADTPANVERLVAVIGADPPTPVPWRQLLDELGLGPFCIQICHWLCELRCERFCRCVCPNPALNPWFTTVGYFDIYSDIDSTTGLTNKSLPYLSLGYGGGPNFAFFGCLQLGGWCPSFSPLSPTTPMQYRFLYESGGGPVAITGSFVCPAEAGTRLISWPQNLGGVAGATMVSTFQSVVIAGAPQPDPIPPAPGAPWVGPSAHYIVPDANGWVQVDPSAVGGGFQVLLGFDTFPVVPQPTPPSPPGPPYRPPSVTPGSAVPVSDQMSGSDLAIIFQAMPVTMPPTSPPPTPFTAPYSNSLSKIHINNWNEVNELDFSEFSTGCCTPITSSLGVQITVDHEQMAAGAWSLGISSCAPTPGFIGLDIPPAPLPVPAGMTLSSRGGWGTINEVTAGWEPCSYTVTLATRPGLTTGLVDRTPSYNSLTFAICAS
ncbi:MAG TPA: hypothetical protein VEK76_03710 [Candidatus Binatia bacterium]|nr:hypothetical protein [Candidatus Binatia bacterium]